MASMDDFFPKNIHYVSGLEDPEELSANVSEGTLHTPTSNVLSPVSTVTLADVSPRRSSARRRLTFTARSLASPGRPAKFLSHAKMKEVEEMWKNVQEHKARVERNIAKTLEAVDEVTLSPRVASQQGVLSSTVPNLGFGVREAEPVQEPPVVKKTAALLGRTDDNDDDTLHNVESIKENLVQKLGESAATVPDLGFGLRDMPQKTKRTEFFQTPSLVTLLANDQGNLTAKLQEERSKRECCEKVIANMHSQQLDLLQKLTVAERLDETKESAMQKAARELDEAHQKCERLEAVVAAKDAALEQQSTEILAQKQRILEYEKKLMAALDTVEDYKEKLRSAEREAAERRRELDVSEASLSSARDELSVSKADRSETEAALKAANSELERLRTSEQAALKNASELGAAVDRANATSSAVEKHADVLRKELRESETREAVLRQKIEESGQKFKQLTEDVEAKYVGLLEELTNKKMAVLNAKHAEQRKKSKAAHERQIEGLRKRVDEVLVAERERCATEIATVKNSCEEELKRRWAERVETAAQSVCATMSNVKLGDDVPGNLRRALWTAFGTGPRRPSSPPASSASTLPQELPELESSSSSSEVDFTIDRRRCSTIASGQLKKYVESALKHSRLPRTPTDSPTPRFDEPSSSKKTKGKSVGEKPPWK